MKISVTSPLENLAAVAIAFGAGLAAAAMVQAYGAWMKRRGSVRTSA